MKIGNKHLEIQNGFLIREDELIKNVTSKKTTLFNRDGFSRIVIECEENLLLQIKFYIGIHLAAKARYGLFQDYQIYTYENNEVYMEEDKGGIVYKYKVVLGNDEEIIFREKLKQIFDDTATFIEQDGVMILSPKSGTISSLYDKYSKFCLRP